MKKAKKDNRSNNVERLKEMKENTISNIEAAKESIVESDMGLRQKKKIQEKNKRRRQSIEGFEEEIADEIEARKQGYQNE